MPSRKYYYYDHEACAFVEARLTQKRSLQQAFLVGVLALVMASGAFFGYTHFFSTPEEVALSAERAALQRQLALAQLRIRQFDSKLDSLSQTDEQLYRTLLDAEPISADTRQAGVGGIDPYTEFSRFSPDIAASLRETSALMDEIERRMAIQTSSYEELITLAERRAEALQQMPALMPANGSIVSGFGMRLHPILRVRQLHTGIDIPLRMNTPIYATGDGVVTEIKFNPTYGHYIVIDHPLAGYTTLYAHLSRAERSIRIGTKVKRGQVIGLSGNSGRSTGPHLHYEVRNRASDTPIDPLPFMAPGVSPQRYQQLVAEAENDSAPLSLY